MDPLPFNERSQPQHLASDNPARFIHHELLERVSQPIGVPARVQHLAFLIPPGEDDFRRRVRDAFDGVLRSFGIQPSSVSWGHRYGVADKAFPTGYRVRLVWEMHTEFYTYTLIFQPPEWTTAPAWGEIPCLPPFPRLGEKLVDLDMTIVPGLSLTEECRAFLGPGAVYGGGAADGQAGVWTTFQLDSHDQEKYVVAAGDLAPGPLGRLVRRIVEIENYYHLILLPLHEYRIHVRELRSIEQRVAGHSEGIAKMLAEERVVHGDQRAWIETITEELAALVRLTEKMRHRLSAASAYNAIFQDRVSRLREKTGEACQAIGAFLHFRVDPSIRSYENFVERADVLAGQLSSLAGMLRTRIDLAVEEQNLALLQSMEMRARLQFLLQRTVESLSVIVIAYYLTGLAGYVFTGLEGFGWIAHSKMWTAGFVPVGLLIGVVTTRRVHRMLEREKRKTEGA
ncbi:MAG: DUF3422 family protein [Nitrospirota bacterium]